MPFLLFSVYFGSLADRHDCRRLIQAAQALFMLVSALWGVLFLTSSLRVYQACLLLVLHGCAGAPWGPGEQLMLHDFVGREELPSAVRLNATFRSLGILFGPVVGSVLLLGLGPIRGIFANIAFYLPLFALTSSYLLALAMLLIGRIANLASMSIGQTIVQLLAPPADRGRVIGLYGVSANGLRAGSGFTVGILGAAIGIHWSLGLSAVALCLGTLAAGIYALRGQRDRIGGHVSPPAEPAALPAGPGQRARDRA